MLIGVLSDTHGRVDTTKAAVDLLQRRGVRHLVHCGDVGSTRVLDLMVGTPSAFVWGNCDYDQQTLQGYASVMGINCCGAIGRLTFDGKIVSVMHGDDHRRMQSILNSQDSDYLFHGHSHVRSDHRVGRVHVVNPGALHRATIKTVALVDTASDDVEFLEVAAD
jgi:putative phosphoesterase